MLTRKPLAVASVVAALGLAAWLVVRGRISSPAVRPDTALQTTLDRITADYRQIIVLMDGADALDASMRARCRNTGRRIFWSKQQAVDDIGRKLTEDYRQAAASGFRDHTDRIRQVIAYVSANGNLRDADKLAFLDVFEELTDAAGTMPARNKLNESLKNVLDELRSIQLAYREEVTRIFSQFATRGATGSREKWEAYTRFLTHVRSRDQILAEYNDDVPDDVAPAVRGAGNEIFGTDFAPKTVALTFDDGPHPKYTEQVTAILRKYGIRACFFELGQNLGTVPAAADVQLSRNADISRRLLAAGHVLANHTYSHRVLAKLSDTERTAEIETTNVLLERIAGQKPLLFRPPYGARNQKVLDTLTQEGLQNVMWTIDSEDWADPIPESIAMRVLHEVNRSHKGIILFHDIHKQSVLALPAVLEELTRQNYTFLAFDKGKFLKSAPPEGSDRAAAATPTAGNGGNLSPYRQSWAVIIGINDYQSWPKLRYSVNDASGIEDALLAKFRFKRENIRKLLNADASRQRIMQVLGDELTDPKKVSREDRVFFFFAGHGATRTLPDGRQIGFIIPVDADASNYYSTAISMTALREACDLIPAKHIYFVMDSCYSGLALSRGAGSFARDRSYIQEVTRRVARQILTAGGADQQVADDGPNGHSVFTWALLQGLDGKADLDGNGVITASELGAYVSPVVASFSKQTPTIGNLVGSEGGEFIFELHPEALSASTQQFEGKGLELNNQLAALEKQITEKQAELLRLQQSIQAESAKVAQLAGTRSAPPPVPPKTRSAYDLDRLALRLYREKRYGEAEKALIQAVELKPGDPTLLNNLGFIYYKMARYADALRYLDKTLAIDPKRKEAHGNIADVLAKLGRNAEAKQHYEEYLALYPGSARAGEVRAILADLN